ncbi:MAG: phosphorylase [Oceanospirillaceae bacterium]|nr:phosphorylase [Oceanospirillaceae bacterium]
MDRLWYQAANASLAARNSGMLKPIDTEALAVTENGISFVIRMLSSLRDKSEAQQRLAEAGDHSHNPFLSPEPALRVCEVPPAHRCVLNKFCVIDRHLLLVTREFEPQSQALNPSDFRALARCMREGPALAFFNGGPDAGASQPHKHLQLLPLDQTAPPPFAALLDAAAARGCDRAPALPFRHHLTALPDGLLRNADEAADWLTQHYRQALNALGIEVDATGEVKQAYNLLLTPRWLLMVPRRCEKRGDVSVNALGFVGWLLVKRQNQAERLKAEGLMRTLMIVSGASLPAQGEDICGDAAPTGDGCR